MNDEKVPVQTASEPATLSEIQNFWEKNPVASAGISHEPGTEEFYLAFEEAREEVEPTWLRDKVYGFSEYSSKRVLDIGCGNGYVLSKYARGGADVWGIDLTRKSVELSRRRFSLEKLDGHFLVGNAEELPYPDGHFDLVTSMGVLHHVPSFEKAVSEIRRVLRPGGRFLMMVYHRDSFYHNVVFPLYRRFHPDLRGMSNEALANHVDGAENPLGRVYTRVEIRQVLHEFSQIEFTVGSLPRNSVPRVGNLIPQALLDLASRRWGWFLYSSALR
ncbi:MAG: class I SAM-dependent methyltransferase [Nitrospinaceae bacterium]|nr:class I SAM-dependent methyltransferase [Nitrospinaceae bacterium]